MSGIRRRHGTRPLRQASPLELDPLERLIAPIDSSTLAGLRDRALLLLGFAAALRRSELVALASIHRGGWGQPEFGWSRRRRGW